MEVALDQIAWRNAHGRRVHARVNRAGVLVFRPYLRDLHGLVVWASGKSQYLISKLLNQLFNATAFTFPSPLFMAIWTSALTAASTGATAGECSYTGYARVSMAASLANFPASAAGSAIQNAVAITFPANGGVLQTGTFFAILDVTTLGAGNILYWGSIASTAINPGDTPQVNVNGLTATEA